MNTNTTHNPYVYQAMLSFNIREGKTDYTMYVESNTRKNAKIQCTLPVPDTEEIKKILAEIGLEPGEVGIDILTLLRLGEPDQYKKLCKSFKELAEEQNMFYLGFTNNCVVMLDAKADLEAGNAYLETTKTALQSEIVPKITRIIVTDKLPEKEGGKFIPEIHPSFTDNEGNPIYKYVPNIKSPFHKKVIDGSDRDDWEAHACIYDLKDRPVYYSKKHRSLMEKVSQYFNASPE